MVDSPASIFISFHRTEDIDAFTAFAARVRAHAEAAPGFRAFRLSVLTSPLLEQALAVSFDHEANAHDWLDQADALLARQGYLRAGLELFVDDTPRSPGVLLVREVVAPGAEESYLRTTERIAQLESERPGYEGASLFPPIDDDVAWVSVQRFRREQHVDAWLNSTALIKVLPERLAQLSEQAQVTTSTSWASTVRVEDGVARVTPEWKTAMTVLLVIYPAGILLTKFMNPWLFAVVPWPWLALFINLVITIALLTWVLTPIASRILRRWLDPVSGRRTTAWGTLGICGCYVVLMIVFAFVGIA